MTKAYKVSCGDDDHGAVVNFAENANAARQMGSGDTCDCGYMKLTAVRAPRFDKYRDVPMTPAIYLAEGWFMCCQQCERHVFADEKPVIRGEFTFCSDECLKANEADLAYAVPFAR